MDTTKIKAFLLAEKHKSFSKVAKEFSYTPSALSHMADALEQELGIKLFNRSHNGVEITEAGKQLYEKFAAVIDAENALQEAAAEIAKGQEGVLRIGTYSSVARHILPEILHSFKTEYPTVKTSVLVEDSMRDWLENDELDVIFTDEYHLDHITQWYPIMEDRYVAAVPAAWFPEESTISREVLYAYPFIQVEEAVLEEYFTYSKFQEIIQIKSIENETAVSMVNEQIGVTVLPALTMKNCPEGVRVLELTPKLSRMIGVQYKHCKNALTTERFVRHLKKKYKGVML